MDSLTDIPEWQRERAFALQEACALIKHKLGTGTKFGRALQETCTKYSGTILPHGKGKEKLLKLSKATLRRQYSEWKTAGEKVEAFVCDYKPGKQKIPSELILEFQRLCTMPGMRKSAPAFRQLEGRWMNGLEIPGLGTWCEWWRMKYPNQAVPQIPPEFPFSESTLYRKLPKANIRALGNLGMAAFKRKSMSITRTSAHLRPCELFVLDDKRPDILVIDEATQKATDVDIYLMQEVGCRRICGFTCRPTKSMNSSDVDALVSRVLASEGHGKDYDTHILLERGTVAMSLAAQAVIEKTTNGRVKIHRTGMDAGTRAMGFAADKSSGHWQGKGTIEAFCAKLDLLLMHLPGQRGNKYENQPANLAYSFSRKTKTRTSDGEKIVVQDIRGGEVGMAELLAKIEATTEYKLGLDCGILWLSQFNAILRKIIDWHNNSPNHEYEGFGQVTQREVAPGVWETLNATN